MHSGLAILVVVSILLEPIAGRLRAPLLLLFLVLSALLGEDGPGGIQFDDFELAYYVGTLALAVILFAILGPSFPNHTGGPISSGHPPPQMLKSILAGLESRLELWICESIAAVAVRSGTTECLPSATAAVRSPARRA